MITLGALLRNFWIAPLAAAALLWASFPPLDLGSLVGVLGWTLLLTSMRLRGGVKSGRQALAGHFAFFLAGLSFLLPLVSGGWIFVAFWCAAFEAIWARFLGPSLRTAQEGASVRWIVAAPLLHLGFDMARTVVFTGFPWLLPGYSGWRNPVLLGSADLLGVHGSTAAMLLLAAGLAEGIARRVEWRPEGRVGGAWASWRPLVPAAAVWAILAAWAALKPASEVRPGPTVLLLQAAIPQQLKEDREASGEPPPTLEEWWSCHERLGADGAAEAARTGRTIDVVVWPETMVPLRAVAPLVPGTRFLAVEPTPGASEWRIGDATSRRVAAISHGAATLAGVLTEDPSGNERNSSVLLDRDGLVVGVQDKQHLTPGGETLLFLDHLPEGLRSDVADYLRRMAGFVPRLVAGEGATLLPLGPDAGAPRAGVLICYESIFPEMPRAMVQDGADLLVNLSNYGWFTGTPQMQQALAMAAFRSAELRRPMVLASNNGVSAVIGPDGGVLGHTRTDVRTYLLAEVPLSSGTTPFAVLGERAAWALGLAGAAMLLWDRTRTAREAPETS